MAPFIDPWKEQPLDWQFFQNGSVVLYQQLLILQEDLKWFDQHSYRTVQCDCSGWRTESDMHNGLASALAFPSRYGRNLDALRDCLTDVQIAFDGGLILVLNHWDTFSRSPQNRAQVVLDILAESSRYHLLLGKRLLILLRVSDSAASFHPVGATPVLWNLKEHSNSAKHE